MAQGKQPKSVELREQMGRRLLAVRRALNRTQKEIADALEIDPRTLLKYEQGSRYPDEATAVRFCDLTGCTTDFLYRGIIGQEMDTVLAARIAAADPDLVALADEAAKRAAAARRTFA